MRSEVGHRGQTFSPASEQPTTRPTLDWSWVVIVIALVSFWGTAAALLGRIVI
jgi:hypothetical protein